MGKTILVIDDDASIVNFLKEDLLAEGYQVLVGYDGQAALQMARTKRPHLIIMDVNMPVFTGPKALEILRGAPETRSIPVLFLTGESDHHVAAASADERVGQLRKPIDLDSFNGIVKDFLAKYPVA
ncbi:MAG TPA: response regulator [Elusimicrobiota bacterium]|nr:response regulator [Elusimicrobiota bacterium]